MEDHDSHVRTEFAGRKAWIQERAPSIPKEACEQLVLLFPVTVVPKANQGIYLDRVEVIPAAVAYRDPHTGVRYVALTWPTGTKNERRLQLYIDLPTSDGAFLTELPFARAQLLLDIRPSLPSSVKRGIEGFLRQYAPLPTA